SPSAWSSSDGRSRTNRGRCGSMPWLSSSCFISAWSSAKNRGSPARMERHGYVIAPASRVGCSRLLVAPDLACGRDDELELAPLVVDRQQVARRDRREAALRAEREMF